MTRSIAGMLALLILLLTGSGLQAAKFIDFEDGPVASSTNSQAPPLVVTNPPPHFAVQSYIVEGNNPIASNTLAGLFARYTGTNVPLDQIVTAASDLQNEYRKQSGQDVSVSFAEDEITNGVVTLYVFEAATSQILVSGQVRTPVVPVITNASPVIPVSAYEISGDTLLTTETLAGIFQKYTGTNITVADILKAGSELQTEYRNRGYPTVNVTVPPQQITNGVVRIRVFVGRLSDISIVHNRYFSSNNIMRALPSVQSGRVLVRPVFQSELDRANANQDRQIYPQIEPGPEVNSTSLILDVKDRLPLHGKIEFNNQNSPATPDLRLNSSMVYNNLWQHEHSLGVQYNFSPGAYKDGSDWNFYDRPLVVNYSAFYRLPLGNPTSVAGAIASKPRAFGYDEATHKFNLPPPSGRPELNFYASRAAIDTGLETLLNTNILDQPGVRTVTRSDVQQDVTINQDVGFRFSASLPEGNRWRRSLSAGADYKTYELTSFKTNTFEFTEFFPQPNGSIVERHYTLNSGTPPTVQQLDYLPLSLHLDAGRPDSLGSTAFGLGISFNTWFSGSAPFSGTNFHGVDVRTLTGGTNQLIVHDVDALREISGSQKSSGYWVTLTPSLSRDFIFHTNWTLSLHADGQWASEPLISNEQYGAGGVASVRGYHEGEVFGDTGWRVNAEIKTAPHVIGIAYGAQALSVRGALFMDYAETYLIDPRGRKPSTALWGTGVGGAASLGSHWEARLLFSVPLLTAGETEAYHPRFNFSLTGQF